MKLNKKKVADFKTNNKSNYTSLASPSERDRTEKDFKHDLILAAKKGYVNTVLALLEYGVDVNAKDRGGRSALSLAIRNGNSRIAWILIGAGAEG